MEINPSVLAAIKSANAQLLVVTKYWNKKETKQIMEALKNEGSVIGWGENRIESLEDKALPRAQTHFIGRLQSRQLPVIVEHCATIHSLASFKHAQRLNDLAEQKNLPLKVFVQVNVAEDPAKEGITAEEVPEFLIALSAFNSLEVLGLSSMGWAKLETDEDVKKKKEEFRALVKLRDEHLPKGLTSAGTSRDFGYALQEGVDIVRIGGAMVL